MKSQLLLLFPLILPLLPAVFLGVGEPVPSATRCDSGKPGAAQAKTPAQKIPTGLGWTTGPETRGVFVHLMFIPGNWD